MKPVELNKQEKAMIAKLPVEHQAVMTKHLLEGKAKIEAEIEARRNTFAIELSEVVKEQDGSTKPGKGGYKVTGLGSRYPVTLYPEQWEIIFSNIETIRSFYNNPANKAKSDALRK